MKLLVRTGIVLLLWDIFIALCVALTGDLQAAAGMLILVPVCALIALGVLYGAGKTLDYLVESDGPGEYDG